MTACGHYNCAWMHGIQFEQWWVCKACGKILWLASPEAAALRLAVLHHCPESQKLKWQPSPSTT
jgi:hypothetical protein